MKKIIQMGMIVLFLCSLVYATKVVEAKDDVVKNSKSGIVIELDTGETMYEYNADNIRTPASTTKVMTIKLVMDALHHQQLSADQMLTTSEYASSMGGSQIYLAPGEQMSVSDLLKAVVIASANDAAVVLAEAIAGTEENFVQMMNDEAARLEMKNTHYNNVTGLHTENHYTTARDLSTIARELLLQYEDEILPLTSTYEDYLRKDTEKPFWLVNTNKLIKGSTGIDGLKTGWTTQAGYCLVATKKQNGMRVITVVMGAENVNDRTADTLALMNYAFANYDKQLISPKGAIVETQENILHKPSVYNIVLSQDISRIIKKTDTGGLITYQIELDKDKLQSGNVKEGIGKLHVYIDNKLYRTIVP